MNPAIRFIHDLRGDDLPDCVIRQAPRCWLDLMETAGESARRRCRGDYSLSQTLSL
jgi:hypothetical protein